MLSTVEPVFSGANQLIGWLGGLALDWRMLLQLGILLLAGSWFYWQVVRRSRAVRMFKGIFLILFVISGLFALAVALRLSLFVTLLGFSIQVLVFTSIVVFQPELRRLLSQIGQTNLLGQNWLDVKVLHDEHGDIIAALVKSAEFLGRTHTGALIVLEAGDGAAEHFLESGVPMDAKVTTELLLTLFHPRTPLHDGAVVVGRRLRLRSAGVLLPLTEDPKLSWQHGTRHRAAIGITEVSDSGVLVVSEETGQLSWVIRGHLEKLATTDALQAALEDFYGVSGNASSSKADKADTEPESTRDLLGKIGERLGGMLPAVNPVQD